MEDSVAVEGERMISGWTTFGDETTLTPWEVWAARWMETPGRVGSLRGNDVKEASKVDEWL